MKQLLDFEINIKIKLSALWGSVMSCYIYCDYFQLYVPGKLDDMINGVTKFGAGDQNVLLGLSSILLVTSLMICLSILLPATINRVINIVVGLIMTVFLGLLAYKVGWYFYKMYAIVEAILTLLIAWQAWNWPTDKECLTNSCT